MLYFYSLKKSIKMKKLLLSSSLKANSIHYHVKWMGDDFRGEMVELSGYLVVAVKHSRPVNRKKELFTKKVQMDSSEIVWSVSLENTDFYSYQWQKIDMYIEIEAKVDGFLFFDTIWKTIIWRELFSKAEIVWVWPERANPQDDYNLIENFKAIDPSSRVKVLVAAGLLIIMLWITTVLGFFDIQLLEAADDEDFSTFWTMLWGTWVAWVSLWLYIKKCMRQYMSFYLKDESALWEYGKSFKTQNVIGGKARVDLQDIWIKIVGYNLEKWQYQKTTGSWKNKRTVTRNIEHQVEAIILCEEQIAFIPKNTEISEYLKSSFSFDDFYHKLHPPLLVWVNHGLDIWWEIQLINEKYMDKKIIWNTKMFKYQDFLRSEW